MKYQRNTITFLSGFKTHQTGEKMSTTYWNRPRVRGCKNCKTCLQSAGLHGQENSCTLHTIRISSNFAVYLCIAIFLYLLSTGMDWGICQWSTVQKFCIQPHSQATRCGTLFSAEHVNGVKISMWSKFESCAIRNRRVGQVWAKPLFMFLRWRFNSFYNEESSRPDKRND